MSTPTGATRWAILASVLLAALLYSLNAKGTVLEAEVVIQAVGSDRYLAQWASGPAAVVGLVAIFLAVPLLPVFGGRRLFLAGAVLLTAGAAGSAVMRTPWQHALSTTVGAASALFMLPALGVAQGLLPTRKLFVYCVMLSLVYAGQVLAEPVGALLAFHPSWRALFVIIALGGTWLVLAGLFLFPDDRPTPPAPLRLDVPGVALFAAGLGLLFFVLYRGNYLGWSVSTPICLGTAALAATWALFVWRELTAAVPFLSVRSFAYRTVALTMVCSLFWCGSLYGLATLLPRFLLLLGQEHHQAGRAVLPMSLAMLATMLLVSRETRRPRYVWLLRLGLAGMTLAGLPLSRVDLYTPSARVAALALAWGVSAGLCLAPIAQLTMQGQRPAEAAATGPSKFFIRALGSALGVLVASILLSRATAWGLVFVQGSVRPGQGPVQVVTPAIRDHMARRGSAAAAAAAQADAVIGHWTARQAEVIGYRSALRFCVGLSAAGLAVACVISTRREVGAYDPEG